MYFYCVGGSSSFSLSDGSCTPVKTKPAAVVAPATPATAITIPAPVPSTPAAAPSSSIATTPVTVFSSVDVPVSGDRRVGVAIGGCFANDLVQNAVLLALQSAGITNIVLRMTKEVVTLPYLCKSLMHEKCDVVLAGCALDGQQADSAQSASLLQQALTIAGVTGSVPVVPGVSVHNDIAAATTALPDLTAQWVASVIDLLQLAENPRAFSQEVVMPSSNDEPSVASIDINDSTDNTAAPAPAAVATSVAAAATNPPMHPATAGSVAKSTAPNPPVAGTNGRFNRGCGQGLGSSITF